MDLHKRLLCLLVLGSFFVLGFSQTGLDDQDDTETESLDESSDANSLFRDTIAIPPGKAVKRVTVVDFGEPNPDNITIITGNNGTSSLNVNRPNPPPSSTTEASVSEPEFSTQSTTTPSILTSTVLAAEEASGDPDPSATTTTTEVTSGTSTETTLSTEETSETTPDTPSTTTTTTTTIPSTESSSAPGAENVTASSTTMVSIGEPLMAVAQPSATLLPSSNTTTAGTDNSTETSSVTGTTMGSSTTSSPEGTSNSTEFATTTESSTTNATEPGSSTTSTMVPPSNSTSEIPGNSTSPSDSTNTTSTTASPTGSTTASPQPTNACKTLGDGLRSGTFEAIVLPSTCSLFVPPATVVASTGQAFNNGTQFAAPGTDLPDYIIIPASEGAEIINRLSLRPVTTPGPNQEVILRNYGNTSSSPSSAPAQPSSPFSFPSNTAQPFGGVQPISPAASVLSSQGSGFQGWGSPVSVPVAPSSPYANLPPPYGAMAIMGLANQGWGGIQGMAQAQGIGLPGTDADWTAPQRNKMSSVLGFGPSYGPSTPTAGILGMMGPSTPSNSGWGRAVPFGERSTGFPDSSSYPDGLTPALQSWDDDTPSMLPYQPRHPSAYGPLPESSDDNLIVMSSEGPISIPRSVLARYDPRLASSLKQQSGPSQAYRSPGLYDSDNAVKKAKDVAVIGDMASMLGQAVMKAVNASRPKRASIDSAMIISLGTGSPKDEWSRNMDALVVNAMNETDQQQRRVHASIVTVPESTMENKLQLAARDQLVSLCVQRCLGVMDPQFNCAARCRITPKSF